MKINIYSKTIPFFLATILFISLVSAHSVHVYVVVNGEKKEENVHTFQDYRVLDEQFKRESFVLVCELPGCIGKIRAFDRHVSVAALDFWYDLTSAT